MTSILGPNFDQGLTAGLFFGICNSVLRAFHRLVIQLSYHIPRSQPGFIRRRIGHYPARFPRLAALAGSHPGSRDRLIA